MTRGVVTRSPPLETLACPACKGALAEDGQGLVCIVCHKHWPAADGHVDLSAPISDRGRARDWRQRQGQMGDWYADLLSDPTAAPGCYLNDYEPLAGELRRISGRVLDIGGGLGVTRHYLAEDADYVNLDPSTEWLTSQSPAMVQAFPELAEPMLFVLGRGEQLPFRAESFDATLALWSLNHAVSPELVIDECLRALKPGGCLVVVLEDMEPGGNDLRGWSLRLAARTAFRKGVCRMLNRPWPTQSDHVLILEDEVLTWTREGFAVERRFWIPEESPRYLGFRFRKR